MKYSKTEQAFILRWAKKIKAVNELGGKCSSCGLDDYFCLDFHHIDTKEQTVNVLINKGARWSLIKGEIGKCSLLCRNCHGEYHSKVNTRAYDIKLDTIKRTGVLRKDIKCSRCAYQKDSIASLDFHHTEEKEFNISDATNRRLRINAEELDVELSKCILLCRNCHVMEQIDLEQFERFKEEIMIKSLSYVELREPVDKDLVIRMYQDGNKQIDIAEKLHCAKSTVSGILKEFKGM